MFKVLFRRHHESTRVLIITLEKYPTKWQPVLSASVIT